MASFTIVNAVKWYDGTTTGYDNEGVIAWSDCDTIEPVLLGVVSYQALTAFPNRVTWVVHGNPFTALADSTAMEAANNLGGTVAVTSGVSGTLTQMAAAIHVSGTIAATAALSGTLHFYEKISGTVATSSALTGSATMRNVGLAGTIATTASLSGTPSATRSISGTIATTASVTALLGSTEPISGSIQSSVTIVGTLENANALCSGTIAVTTALSATAQMHNVGLQGSASVTTALSGTMVEVFHAAATVSVTAGVTASASVRNVGLAGSVSVASGLSGTVRNVQRISGTIAGATSALSARMAQTYAMRGAINTTVSLDAQLSRLMRLIGTSATLSDAYVFPAMTQGNLVTFVRLDSISPTDVMADGGYVLDLVGQFPVGVPLAVHVGLTVTDKDPLAYSGKAGQGSVLFATSSSRLRCYTPELDPHYGPYSVTVISPTWQSSLSQILTAHPPEQRTGTFGLRGVLPTWWKTGPRAMSDLKDLNL